ncbi:GDSL-type esterase/lipase family protein [Streptomyces sp. Je 1-79]|uniref:GDSL-type esterase/lipase family protein n=1 Tax=Streptomyces sp. Je 1-79 TaxID=2943847 RepID=UPI0021A891D8|nr:GDSL-type esterase/lipase family protein [Streptomyces sp. Je 1-79]MCT4351983.1 GDSL-type esterase/lipase family protein [Streptomyces sp. Je 1-79]
MRRRSVLLAAGTTLTATLATPFSRAFAAAPAVPVLDHRVERVYDGQSYTDLSAKIAKVRGLPSGTILATFSTTSRNPAMTLVSASDRTKPATDVTVCVSAGRLQFSVRDNGVVKQNHLTRTMYDDGTFHTVAITVTGSGTTFYADGRPVLTTGQSNFFGSVSPLTALNIARNLDSEHPGGESFYTGTIKRVAVYNRALSMQEVAAESVRVDLADLGTISSILNSGTPAVWLTTGDSITHGALWTNGWRSYSEHFQERVRWELGRPKNSDFVIDTGVSGSTTNDLVAKFTERVSAFGPKVVSIMLGTNDVATASTGPGVYRANLRKLVANVRALPGGAVPLLQSPNPVDVDRWPDHAALADYVQIMREVAAELNVVLIDHHAHWLATNGGTVPLGLLGDGLHPDQRGHLLLAKKMIRDLRVFDPASRVCALTIP